MRRLCGDLEMRLNPSWVFVQEAMRRLCYNPLFRVGSDRLVGPA
jgi:hypothetical protein